MVESTRQVQSRDPFERFNEAINDPRLYETYRTRRTWRRMREPELAPYADDRAGPSPIAAHEPVPLFLSDYEDDRLSGTARIHLRQAQDTAAHFPHVAHRGRRACVGCRGRRCSRCFPSNSTRNAIANTKASLAGVAPVSVQSRRPKPRRSSRASPRVAVRRLRPEARRRQRRKCRRRAARSPSQRRRASPSREEITAAYQSAIKSQGRGARARRARALPPPAAPRPGASIRMNSRPC